jgi:hypothetical protein
MAQDRFIGRPVPRDYTLQAEGPLYHASRDYSTRIRNAVLTSAFFLGVTIPLALAARDRQIAQPPVTPAPTSTESDKSPISTTSHRESVPLGLIASKFLPGNELGEKIIRAYDRHGISTRLFACFPDNGGPVTGTVINDLPLRNEPHTKSAPADTLPAGTRVSYNLVARTTSEQKIDGPGIPLNEFAVLLDGLNESVFAATFYGEPKIAEDKPKTCAPIVTEPIQPK